MADNDLFGIAATIIGLILLTTALFISYKEYDGNFGKFNQVEVKCYDRYSNEIVGGICLSNKTESYDITLLLSVLFGVCFFVVGCLELLLGEEE